MVFLTTNIRSHSLFTVSLLLLFLLVGSAWSNASELTVVSGFPDLESQYYAAAFSNVAGHPISVQSYPPGVLAALLQKDLLHADVVMGLPVELLEELKMKGLTRPFASTHAAFIPVDLYDPAGHWYAQFVDALTVVYIPEYLAEHQLEPPDSWADLADERWAEQIILASPVTSSIGFSTYALLSQLFGMDSELFRQITENVGIHTRWDETPAAILGQGGHALAVLSFNTALTYLGRGVPLKAAWLEEGGGMIAVGLSILEGSTHPAAAEFANFLLSLDGQNLLAASARYRTPVHTQAYIPPWIITLDRIELAAYDWTEAAEQRETLLDRWNSLIVGGTD